MKKLTSSLSEKQLKLNGLNESTNVESTEDFMFYGKTVLRENMGTEYSDDRASHILESIVKQSKTTKEMLIRLNESVITNEVRLTKLVESLMDLIVENPNVARYAQLNECLKISGKETLKLLTSKSLHFIELMNTTEFQTRPLSESVGVDSDKTMSYDINNPYHLMAICEALETSIAYSAGQSNIDSKPYASYINASRNIRIQYSNDIAALSSSVDSDKLLFDSYLRDYRNTYYFSPSRLSSTIQSHPFFIYLCMSYMDKFVEINHELLNDRGFSENLDKCLNAIKLYRDSAGVVPIALSVDSRTVNFAKLYQTWELTTNLAQNVSPASRALILSFLKCFKPMLDSIRIFKELKNSNLMK